MYRLVSIDHPREESLIGHALRQRAVPLVISRLCSALTISRPAQIRLYVQLSPGAHSGYSRGAGAGYRLLTTSW